MANAKSAPLSGLACSRGLCVVKKVEPARLAVEIEAALGIRLVARAAGDTVHGHITTLEKNIHERMERCALCDNGPFDAGIEHHCVEIVLYEEDEGPRVASMRERNPHESTLARHGLSTQQVARLQELVKAH